MTDSICNASTVSYQILNDDDDDGDDGIMRTYCMEHVNFLRSSGSIAGILLARNPEAQTNWTSHVLLELNE